MYFTQTRKLQDYEKEMKKVPNFDKKEKKEPQKRENEYIKFMREQKEGDVEK